MVFQQEEQDILKLNFHKIYHGLWVWTISCFQLSPQQMIEFLKYKTFGRKLKKKYKRYSLRTFLSFANNWVRLLTQTMVIWKQHDQCIPKMNEFLHFHNKPKANCQFLAKIKSAIFHQYFDFPTADRRWEYSKHERNSSISPVDIKLETTFFFLEVGPMKTGFPTYNDAITRKQIGRP